MTIEILKEFFLWCTLLNYGLLLFWAGIFIFAHDWLKQIHARWFALSREQFDGTHYSLMGGYKVGIFLLNLMPYLALEIIST